YFDILSGQHIIGEGALEAHINDGGNPADIYTYQHLLLSEKIDEFGAQYYFPRYENKLSNEQILDYGSSILKLINTNGRRVSLNKSILHRAHIIGLGPSPDQIKNHENIGSLGKL